MSDRLTSPGASTSTPLAQLAFPAALILIAFHSQNNLLETLRGTLSWVAPSLQKSFYSGLAVIFALECGVLLRGMLPQKAPASHKAFTSTLGALAASLPLTYANVNILVPWILVLASWSLLKNFDTRSVTSRILSGLFAGSACSLNFSTSVVVIPALLIALYAVKEPHRRVKGATVVWCLAFLVGLSPYFFGISSLPPMPLADPGVEEIQKFLTTFYSQPNWFLMPFLLLGTGVACFQSRKTLLGLFVPILAGLPIIMLAFVTFDPFSMLYLPIALLSGYGAFRIVRGIEQGIRNVRPSTAKGVIPAATCLVLIGYGGLLAYALSVS